MGGPDKLRPVPFVCRIFRCRTATAKRKTRAAGSGEPGAPDLEVPESAAEGAGRRSRGGRQRGGGRRRGRSCAAAATTSEPDRRVARLRQLAQSPQRFARLHLLPDRTALPGRRDARRPGVVPPEPLSARHGRLRQRPAHLSRVECLHLAAGERARARPARQPAISTRFYFPRNAQYTGDLDVHEIAIDADTASSSSTPSSPAWRCQASSHYVPADLEADASSPSSCRRTAAT